MSFLDEDAGKTDIEVAKNALVAAALRNRPAVVALLEKYGATKLRDLRLRDLQPFTKECQAIEAPQARAPSPYVSLSQVPFGHIVERYTNEVAYFVSSTYDGTGNHLLTTLNGMPKPDIPQEEFVLDLGLAQRPAPAVAAPPAPTAEPLNYYELWMIGDTVDDCKNRSGVSFARDAEVLIELLDKRGFRVVRK